MSDLSPECTPKQTSADALEFMGLRPMIGWVDLLLPALSAVNRRGVPKPIGTLSY
jgi:hypothetical protein